MKSHEEIHKCNECDNSFASPRKLITHVKQVHEKKKPIEKKVPVTKRCVLTMFRPVTVFTILHSDFTRKW
jgi:hypothetical protein